MIQHMLSTIDNPYNPFTHYDEWYAYDTSSGYHSASFLARIAVSSSDLSDADQAKAIEDAIDEIVKENVSGVFVKISNTKTEN